MKKEIIEDIEGKEKDIYAKWNRALCIGGVSLILILPSVVIIILLNLVYGIALLCTLLSFSIVSVFLHQTN